MIVLCYEPKIHEPKNPFNWFIYFLNELLMRSNCSADIDVVFLGFAHSINQSRSSYWELCWLKQVWGRFIHLQHPLYTRQRGRGAGANPSWLWAKALCTPSTGNTRRDRKPHTLTFTPTSTPISFKCMFVGRWEETWIRAQQILVD